MGYEHASHERLSSDAKRDRSMREAILRDARALRNPARAVTTSRRVRVQFTHVVIVIFGNSM